MTCNPNWRKIQDNLLPSQQPSDHPDICTDNSISFKKRHLLSLITKEKYFGEVAKIFLIYIRFSSKLCLRNLLE